MNPSEQQQWVTKGSRWKHFKGGEYTLEDIARDCEDSNRYMVIYRNNKDQSLWVRELFNFIGIHETGVKRFERMP